MNITLLLTEQCNLNCQYCYCKKNSSSRMSFELAKNIIDKAFQDLDTTNERLNVLLLGGEPFLEFDLVKDVYSYLSDRTSPQGFSCKTVTNGTLLNDSMKEWLQVNKLEVTLSLDGVGSDHNSFRDDSFDTIDLDFFQKLTTCYEINMTIVPETIGNMARNVIYLENKGFRVKTTLADGVDWSGENNSNLLVQQIQVLMDHYYRNIHIDPCTILSVATSIVGGSELNACQAGISSKSFDTLGREYSCHRCTDLYNKGEWSIPKEKLDLKNIGLLYQDCEFCLGKNICNTCPATIAAMQGDLEGIKANCKLQKVIIYSNAIFHSTLLTNYPDHMLLKRRSGAELQGMISGCRKILKELN